ncbi:MAG: 1-phosphofructokinase family hexose kinase [Thermoleophilia bacterium]|nr:1-phosphofructokinase family hexose kinase [Thermoleophilia bacterium]
MIVTVTLNAAIDRTLLVPNFRLGQRHRASASLASAGGKGINVARALKRLGVPVVCTGLAGGRTGVQIVERLTSEGLLNDFVRIRGESRTSTAVVDPTSSVYTEINEWGPEVEEQELAMLEEKLAYLTRGADFVVFAGSLPRGVADGFYEEAIREANRRGVPTVLDVEGEPLRRGIAGEPYLVTPNVGEAEALVGHEFAGEGDLGAALDEIVELGARNAIVTTETGCVALFREDRAELRLEAVAPHLEPASTVGSGDVLLAGFIAARVSGRPLEEAVRAAVATGAASVLEVGAGRFDVREVSRLAPLVTVGQLEPAASE